MKQVAILGGGPAGAFAAERLAAAGLCVTLFDEKLAWEKPCGGGLTWKAYHRYPFLIDNDTPKRLIREAVLASNGAGKAPLPLPEPLLIYSRLDLNRMLLARAERAGAQLERERVRGIERHSAGWRLRTARGTARADFCVVATGARNPLRELGTAWSASDMMIALGYYVPGTQERIDLQFFPGRYGYAWVFPRCGHLSVGICGKGEPAASLRRRLEIYMDENGIRRNGASFYCHLLPSLAAGGWRRNRVDGDGWLAVGDAAGLVDPITGEGLYYALRSADLAAQALISGQGNYRTLLWRDFAADLECGARFSRRFFAGRFLLAPVVHRMVQLTRRSATFRAVMQDLLSGRQAYGSLRSRVWGRLPRTLAELVS